MDDMHHVAGIVAMVATSDFGSSKMQVPEHCTCMKYVHIGFWLEMKQLSTLHCDRSQNLFSRISQTFLTCLVLMQNVLFAQISQKASCNYMVVGAV